MVREEEKWPGKVISYSDYNTKAVSVHAAADGII